MVKPHSQTILFRENPVSFPFASSCRLGSHGSVSGTEQSRCTSQRAVDGQSKAKQARSSWVKIVSQPMNILDVTSKVLIFTMFFFWGHIQVGKGWSSVDLYIQQHDIWACLKLGEMESPSDLRVTITVTTLGQTQFRVQFHHASR